MDKRTRKKLEAIQVARSETEIYAFLGDLRTGQVEVDPNVFTHVYATVAFTGQVIKVRNYKYPNRFRLPVKIGGKDEAGVMQVIGIWKGIYPDLDLPEVPKHPHTWGQTENPAWIRKEQILELLPSAIGGMVVRVNAGYYGINGVIRAMPNTEFDMTAYIPSNGAVWVSVSIDVDGNITYTTSTPAVENRALLEYTSVPVLGVEYRLLFSCRLYEGQTEVLHDEYSSDIFDPRFIQGSAVGSGVVIDTDPTMIADSDEVVPSQAAVVDFVKHWVQELGSDLFANAAIGEYRWVADGSTTEFELTDIVEELKSVHDNSLMVDPFDVNLSDDGCRVIFLSAPVAGHVVLASGYLRSS